MSVPNKPSRSKDKNVKLVVEIEVDVDKLISAYENERPSNWMDDPGLENPTLNERIKDQFHWVKGSGIKLIKVQ